MFAIQSQVRLYLIRWVAHWQEMISDPGNADRAAAARLYTGATRRDYVAMSQRS